MTKFVVFGCGMQAQAIVYDLLTFNPDAEVRVCDSDESKVEALLARYAHLGEERLTGMTTRIAPEATASLDAALTNGTVAISAVPYHLNPALTEAAIRNGVSFCDLGGNIDVVKGQFALNDAAQAANVAIVPDCGIAPGAVSVFARRAVQLLGEDPHSLTIRVGGLPQNPSNPLGYAYVFNVEGLINEYIEPVEVLRNGRLSLAEPMGDEEEGHYPGIGNLVAANTSGGLSTLAATYEGRIKELNYKTLRYPGHWATIRKWMSDGWLKGPTRSIVEAILSSALPTGKSDLMAVRVEAANEQRSRVARIQFVDRANARTGHTAMMRTTGFSIAIVAQLIASRRHVGCGVFKQEELPADVFVGEWVRRELPYEERVALR